MPTYFNPSLQIYSGRVESDKVLRTSFICEFSVSDSVNIPFDSKIQNVSKTGKLNIDKKFDKIKLMINCKNFFIVSLILW